MTPKDFLGNIPKVGDTIAVIINTSTRSSILSKAIITEIKETKQQIRVYIKPLDEKTYNVLLRSYIVLLDNVNDSQFIIINDELHKKQSN